MTTFNINHYVPILKWKRAEQRALFSLDENIKKGITPLIELVMPTVSLYKKKASPSDKPEKKTQEEMYNEIVSKFKGERIEKIPEEILHSWGTRTVFVDFSLIYTSELRLHGLKEILSDGTHKGLKIIPVLNLNDDTVMKKETCSIAKENTSGICLRITPSDLIEPNSVKLNEKIDGFIREHKLTKNSIDLLIDIKEKASQYSQFMRASQEIGNLKEWRNFIFACGAFPETMATCKPDDPPLPRSDWQNWLYHSKIKNLKRKPSFADYTIRYPIFDEALQHFNPTASIKYSLDTSWRIMKGGVRKFEDYLANAKLLVEDTNEFYGKYYSWGDEKIAQKAAHFHLYIKNPSIKGTGRNEDWIAWGMNHHMTLVADQLSNLS